MNKRILQIFTLIFILSIGMISCVKEELPPLDEGMMQYQEYSSEVALEWMKFYVEIERYTPGYRPPVSARTAGYIGLTAYESVVQGSEEFNSMVGQFDGLTEPAAMADGDYHWPTSLNAAMAKSFVYFFPTAPAAQQHKLFALERKYIEKFSSELPPDVYNRSKAYGETVAAIIFEWSRSDQAGHEGYLHNNDPQYSPPAGTGYWQPTYPDFAPALLPHWGQARTFAASQDDGVVPPLAYREDPNSELYIQAKEVMVKVQNIKNGNPDYPQDEWIADFWSDDCPTKTFTPAGRWIAIANQLIDEKEISLDLAVFVYAKLGLGLNDAGVRCWAEKYKYNVLRPIEYIRNVMGQSDWNTIMCPSSGNFYTPPFPAYPSGHATFGAVSAEVLTDVFGYNHTMTDRCHEGRVEFISTPRSFNNFYEMAEENAYSRLPIGVHFRMDAETGLDLGYQIGKKVNNLPWYK